MSEAYGLGGNRQKPRRVALKATPLRNMPNLRVLDKILQVDLEVEY